MRVVELLRYIEMAPRNELGSLLRVGDDGGGDGGGGGVVEKNYMGGNVLVNPYHAFIVLVLLLVLFSLAEQR